MGLDRMVYAEPFIKIEAQYEEVKREVKGCVEHGDQYGHFNNCPECGMRVQVFYKKENCLIWIDDIIGNDNFMQHVQDDEVYLISNLRSDDISCEENEMQMVSSTIITEKVESFRNRHIKDISKLEIALDINVKVEFGILYSVR